MYSLWCMKRCSWTTGTQEHIVILDIGVQHLHPADPNTGVVAVVPEPVHGLLIEVLHIHASRSRRLTHVAHALGLSRLFARLRKDREQDRCQDRDDGDND